VTKIKEHPQLNLILSFSMEDLLPVTCCQLPVTCCQLPVASCQLPVASYLLPVTCCQLPVASYLLPVGLNLNWQLETGNWQQLYLLHILFRVIKSVIDLLYILFQT